MSIQEHLDNFIINHTSGQFTLADVKKSFNAKIKISKIILEDHLEESPFLFSSPAKDTIEKYYVPKNIFFKKAEFNVTPTAFEIKKGILFSGHRFIPFYSQELFPTESFEIKKETGSIIKTKSIKVKIEDLYHYYSLLGAEGIIENLTADYIENIDLIGHPSQKVKITVFDFCKFYEKYSFTAGMSMKFTVEDWFTGRFSVTVNSNIVTDEDKHKWFESLEEGLYKVFDERGPYLEIPEQLSLGYYYSGTSILKSPPCSIDEFIKNNEKIQVKFFENNTILWYPGELSLSSEPVSDLVSISQGSIESLDAILNDLGSPVSSVEIKAFIRDARLSGNDISSLFHKIIPESELSFKDKAQEIAFLNYLEEMWEDISFNNNNSN